MTTNRLKLDFALSSTEERLEFATTYLEKLSTPTEKELETIANYILWGKDLDGKNVVQRKEIQLETRNKTWAPKEEESLEALIESSTPTLQNPLTQFRTKKETFSREEARKNAPLHILPQLENLWREIDTLDLTLNFYDLARNKRKNPPRDSLLINFTPEEQNRLKEKAEVLPQFLYLKMRHLLVEKRREQFTLRDSYQIQITRRSPEQYAPPPPIFFDSDIKVFPLGLCADLPLDRKIFPAQKIPDPSDFTEEDLSKISSRLWAPPPPSKLYFDFRELEHVYNVFQNYDALLNDAITSDVESTLKPFFSTLNFYLNFANLSPLQLDILKRKIRKEKNQDIASHINQKYNKTYNANYISTIFRQKIIPLINSAAALHHEIISNIFFPENFKRCKQCGRTLLLISDNFVRKTKSKDGFVSHCKQCDKEKRGGLKTMETPTGGKENAS